jgi:hypothetical protein
MGWMTSNEVTEANHKKTKTVWLHFPEMLKEVKIMVTESRMVAAKGREFLLNGCTVSILQDKNSSWDYGNGCTI